MIDAAIPAIFASLHDTLRVRQGLEPNDAPTQAQPGQRAVTGDEMEAMFRQRRRNKRMGMDEQRAKLSAAEEKRRKRALRNRLSGE